MAIYAIGDIHGCLIPLQTIFEQGLIRKDDKVIFLGDYIDRGPQSKEIIDWFLKNKNHYDFEFIRGNHEIMMLSARDNPHNLSAWLFNGGAATLDSYGIGDDPNWPEKVDQSHWLFLENTIPYYQYDKTIFVHAGLDNLKSLTKQNDDDLYWKKYETPTEYPNHKVVCGHTSRKNGKIADFGHTICIDTYAYGGQWLTCLDVEKKTFIQSNNSGEIIRGSLI